MAKKTKSFMHPADRFISKVEQEQAQEEQEARQEALARMEAEASAARSKKEQERKSKPAPSPLQATELNKRKGRRAAPVAPDGMKPAYIEKRTKRVQLVFQPSLFDKVRAIADSKDLSLNEYIHQLLEQTVAQQEDK